MGIECPLTLLFLACLPFAILSLHSVSLRQRRQFTIRGMLVFTFLWAVCLSQVSVLGAHRIHAVVWRQDWIVLFAWLVLAVFYERTRQFAVLLLHGSGILLCVYLFAIAFVAGNTGLGDRIQWFLLIATCGGSFTSLTFFSIIMLLAILRRRGLPIDGDNRS